MFGRKLRETHGQNTLPCISSSTLHVASVMTAQKRGRCLHAGQLDVQGDKDLKVVFTSSYPVLSAQHKWRGLQQKATGESVLKIEFILGRVVL